MEKVYFDAFFKFSDYTVQYDNSVLTLPQDTLSRTR